jgi:hypothetical protein
VEFFLAVLAASEKDHLRLVVSVERVVLPLIQAMQSPMEQEHFIGVVSRALGITPEAVRASLARLPKGEVAVEAVAEGKAGIAMEVKRADTPARRHERRIRAIMAAYPDTELAERLEAAYTRIIGPAAPGEPVLEQDIFASSLEFGEVPEASAADDLIRAFEKAVLAERLAHATVSLRNAETAKDADAIRQAAEEVRELAKALASFS